MRRGAAGPVSSSHTEEEAASVLNHSLSLARRRGHAQLTPLHVAATLLTSPKSTTLFKSACFKTQPLISSSSKGLGFEADRLTGSTTGGDQYYPLMHYGALELCFNVALNRLPTASSTPLLIHSHPQPSLSNALIAALKRAQAQQRRGSGVEQQFQPSLLAIKVELEQLILSILDDPSVSRVMREAGFSSTAVKTKIEENFSSFSSSPVFNCYSNSGGIYSSPPSPPDHLIRNNSTNFWQTTFCQNLAAVGQNSPLLFPTRTPHVHGSEEDVKLILEILLTKKTKSNIVIVGDSMTSTEGLVLEITNRIEKRDSIVPEELKKTHFIKIQFSSVPLRYMKREEVEMNMLQLKEKIDTFLEGGKRVIVYTGDLNWTLVDEKESGFGYNPVEHLVADIGEMISEYNTSSNYNDRVCLMAIANYQTYMRCQMKLKNQWRLQPISIPCGGGLALSLNATSVQETKISSSCITSQVELDTDPFCSKEETDKFTCCDECTSGYEKAAAVTLINKDLNKTSTRLPFWLQYHTTDMQKEGSVELNRKWNKLCHIRHQTMSILNNANSPLFDHRDSSNIRSYPCPSIPSLLNTNSLIHSNSVYFARTSSCSHFRRQKSCHIELNYNSSNHKGQVIKPNLYSLKNIEEKEMEITLALGNSMISNGGKLLEMKQEVLEKLTKNVPWQVETISSILEALVEELKSGKNENWLLIEGNDIVGKGRFARAMAESLFGSDDYFLHLNMRVKENEKDLLCGTLENALRVRGNLVVLVENIDVASTQFLTFLSNRLESGRSRAMSRKDIYSGKIIFILTKDDSTIYKDGDLGKRRKVEGGDSPNKAKFPRIVESKNACKKENAKKEVYQRLSSSNTLDLNIEAEDDENKNESEIPESTHYFSEMIINRFVFNGDSKHDKKMISSKY